MKHLIIIFITCFCTCAVSGQRKGSPCSIEGRKMSNIQELGKVYRSLRIQQEACSKWGSGLHVVMDMLLDSLTDRKTSAENIFKLMGKPDVIVLPNGKSLELPSPLDSFYVPGDGHYFLGQKTATDSVIIYEWRPGHDYIWFDINNGISVREQWWFAGD